jgi:hypothetical protein
VKQAAVKPAPAVLPTPRETPAKKKSQASPYVTTALGIAVAVLLIALGWASWSSARASRNYDQALQMAFEQAVRDAAIYPQERKENLKRFLHLGEVAKGTRFEPMIDKEIEKFVPKKVGASPDE